MKCASCDKPSLYEYALTDKVSIFYCVGHLPKFLDEKKKLGLLKKTPIETELPKAEVVAPVVEPTVEETPAVEEESIEPTVEESTEEEPKPKKKAVKKKAE